MARKPKTLVETLAPPTANVQIRADQAPDLELTNAILFYSSRERLITAATHHDVRDGIILAGKTLAAEAMLETIASACGRKSSTLQPIPANVLAVSESAVAWWRPASPAPMFFDIRDKNGNRDKKNPLNRASGTRIPQPPLVFLAAKNSLRVFALIRNQRPLAKTRLYCTPYRNVFNDEYVCTGSQRIDSATIADIQKIETGFFSTTFTHWSRDTHLSADLEQQAWSRARKTRHFPTDYLKRTRHTLTSAFAGIKQLTDYHD
jgi:PRTRC genetic system protein B